MPLEAAEDPSQSSSGEGGGEALPAVILGREGVRDRGTAIGLLLGPLLGFSKSSHPQEQGSEKSKAFLFGILYCFSL